MARPLYTVRVINYLGEPDTLPMDWLEQMIYMGHARLLSTEDYVDFNKQKRQYQVIEFRPPRYVNDWTWAEENAARMQSFHINAVAAPEWWLRDHASGKSPAQPLKEMIDEDPPSDRR